MTVGQIGMNFSRPVPNNVDNPYLNILKNAIPWQPTGAKTATVTVNASSPATITWTGHGLTAGACFMLSNKGGTMPTESTTGHPLLTADDGGPQPYTYYVLASGLGANSFQFSTSPGGTAIITSGSSQTVTADCNNCDNISLDANGYPTSMTLAHGAGTATSYVTDVLRPFHLGRAPYAAPYNYEPGTYVLQFSGAGTVSLATDFALVGHSTGGGRDIYYVATPSTGGCDITITNTPVNNMALIWSPGSFDSAGNGGGGQTGTPNAVGANEARYNSAIASNDYSQMFTEAFLNKVKIFNCFRFMQSTDTIQNTIKSWADRSFPAYFTWNNEPRTRFQSQMKYIGTPYEIQIGLCNRLGVDGFFNVPMCAGADPNFYTNMATLIRDTLNFNLKCYIEYGNEQWNQAAIGGAQLLPSNIPELNTIYALDPYQYLYTQGAATFPSESSDVFGCVLDFSIYQMVLVADAFKAVFTGANSSRLVALGSGQAGNVTTYTLGLTTPHQGSGSLWSGTAASHWDGFTTAPYFGYDPPEAWTADGDSGKTKFFQDMQTGLIPSTTAGAITVGGGGAAYTATSGHGYTDGSPPPNGTFFVLFMSGWTDSSSTSNTIGTGSKTFTIAAGQPAYTGQVVTVTDASGNPNRMSGDITSYSGTTLTINVTSASGSGTISSWNLDTRCAGAWSDTSATSNTIGTGTKTFTVAHSNNGAYGGATVTVTDHNNSANTMTGTVTTYSGTTLTLNIASTTGSGTISSWDILSAGPTIALDSMTTRFTANNLGNFLGETVFGYPGSSNYVVFCYTSQTAAGSVSPSQFRTCGTRNNGLASYFWGGWVGGQVQMWIDLTQQFYAIIHGTYGLRMIGYESGQGYGSSGSSILQQLELDAQWDPRMTDVYKQYYRGLWAVSNNDLWIHYVCALSYSNDGGPDFWGVMENILEPTTPKYQALADLLFAPSSNVFLMPQVCL